MNGVVYWKHLPGMKKETDGYIGISKHFEERMKQHHRDAFVRKSIYTVHEQMRIHQDNIITKIIFEGHINDCYDLEEQLRPNWHIGWNMAIGGGRPGSGWKPSKDWLCNRLYHPEYGEVQISIDFKLLDFARKYLKPNKSSNGYSIGNISKLLRGEMPQSFGWELANLQLANKVRERNNKDWTDGYLKKNNKVIHLYKSGRTKFAKYINKKSSTLNLKQVLNGANPSRCGWKLATKEEWENSSERLEFK